MRFATLVDSPESFDICILVPAIKVNEIRAAYVTPHQLPASKILIIDLPSGNQEGKLPVREIRRYLDEELVPILNEYDVKHIICSDPAFFRELAGVAKSDANIGYVLQGSYGPWDLVYVPNYTQIFYEPAVVRERIHLSVSALKDKLAGTYAPPGSNIIHSVQYPKDTQSIKNVLDMLLDKNQDLTCDIETFSLKHHTAGIGTITFCWNQHEGVAFPVDYVECTEQPGHFGKAVTNTEVRQLLKDFFIRFEKKLIFHKINFDAYVLIYQLFMRDILDTEGLLYGLNVMLKNWDDTALITYLATNSCAGNRLSLKDQAQSFAGNYAMDDIMDITKIPLDKLLEYNLVDGLSTWFTYNKNYPVMVADDQEEIYTTLFKPAMLDVIQMQLTGLPLDMNRVREVRAELEGELSKHTALVQGSAIVQEFTNHLKEEWAVKRNSVLKKKRVTANEAPIEFNPGSHVQLQKLLFEHLELPILAYTKTKQPSTDGDTLKDLRQHTKSEEVSSLLNALMEIADIYKILSSFIPAMENAIPGPDGWHYLCGNFNLGGTVSGRLSSNDPNMQNLPANSKYGLMIKSCFAAPPGWLLVGLDFMALEDRISALTTKDENKLKVYIEGYDGHCLRAFAYFGNQMQGIDPDSVESINSIEDRYPQLRQESKTPTFALTYQGTYKTLMTKMGWDIEKAKQVEASYRSLYSQSISWVNERLQKASETGYVTVAFGLRVRTPLLAQVIRGTRKTPYKAEAEGRTAGNALGQSWGLLNTRAAVEFMGKVRNSAVRTAIRPCAHIHDAQYYMIQDDLDTLMFVNEHLVKAVQWQDHPDIYHDKVKLGGKLSVFYPSWQRSITIPNYATADEILTIVAKSK